MPYRYGPRYRQLLWIEDLIHPTIFGPLFVLPGPTWEMACLRTLVPDRRLWGGASGDQVRPDWDFLGLKGVGPPKSKRAIGPVGRKYICGCATISH